MAMLANCNGALRSIEDLPRCFRSAYASFRYFNPIQSDSFAQLFGSDMNVVLSAPTGGGKTVCMELAILRLLSRHVDASTGHFRHRPGLLKVVYLAPAKALVQEKVQEWTARFGGALGLAVKEVTGDTDREDLAGMDATDIICTTPEKFDSLTRRQRDRGGMRYFNEIALVLIDEVHLLTEDRGPSLEAGAVSRIKLVSCMTEMRGQPIASVRFVAVSATVPNVRDLAEWLGVPAPGVLVFGEETRPVPLQTVVRGYPKTTNDFLFDRRLSDNLYAVLAEFSRGRPALVFCPSRAGTSAAAALVAREAARRAGGARPSELLRDPAHHARLAQAAAGLGDAQLRECVAAGVGFHHAAMQPEDRAAVEALFRAADLLVLCTTSTLAVGVNLPAFLVVIKGTRRYAGAEAADPSGYQEYERSTCLQMVGRAGRPQFDTQGVAVIMTERQNVPRYQTLVSGAEPVESRLRDALPEFLNAEIALRTVGDVSTAIAWLRTTYFHVRVRADPAAYAVPPPLRRDAASLERWMREALVLSAVRELAKQGLVRTDEDGFSLEPLQPGVIMAENYVRLPTMALVAGCPPGGGAAELLWVVARSAELSGIKLRRNEKKALNALNRGDGVRFHVMSAAKPDRVADRVATAADKIFLLLNYALADDPGDKLEYALRQDAEQAAAVGARLAAAMVRYFCHAERASEAFAALLLQKSLKQRMWTGSATETRQVPGLGGVTAARLAAAGVHSLRQLAAVEPRKLEALAQRPYPWGSETHDAVQRRLPPPLTLECVPLGWAPGGRLDLQLTLTRGGSGDGSDAAGQGGAAADDHSRSSARLLVGTLHDNALLCCRALCLDSFASPLTFRLRTRTAAAGAGERGTPIQVVASVVHERLVGVDLAVKTVVPHNAALNGQLPPPAPAGAEGAHSPGDGPPPETPSGEEDGPPAKTPPSERRQQTLHESLQPKPKLARAGAKRPGAATGTAAPEAGEAAAEAQTPAAPVLPAAQQALGEAQRFMHRKLQAAAALPAAPPPARPGPAGGRWGTFAATPGAAASAPPAPAAQASLPASALWSSRAAAPLAANQGREALVQPRPPQASRAMPAAQAAPRAPAGTPPPFAHFAFGAFAARRAAAPVAATPQAAAALRGASPAGKRGPVRPTLPEIVSATVEAAPAPAAGAAPLAAEGAKRAKLHFPSLAWLSSKYVAPAVAAAEGLPQAPSAAPAASSAAAKQPPAPEPARAAAAPPALDLSQALGFL